MNDTLQRFLFEHAAIRGDVAHLDATWRAVEQRYGLRIIEDPSLSAGKVKAADPLRASASVDEGGIDLFVFDEE